MEECIIKIIEDKYALEMGLRIIMETAERHFQKRFFCRPSMTV